MKVISTRISLMLAVSVAACSTGLSARAAGGPKQWRIVWTESPQTRAVVCWNTASAGTSHRVHYDTRPRGGRPDSYRLSVPCSKNGAYSDDLHYHHAELKDLTPATTYYFVMASDNANTREFHFTTAPAEDVPFKIIYGGDSRSGISSRRGMNQRIAALAAKDASILAFAHGGDYVGSGTNLGQWDVWMSDHELTVTASGRVLPVIPARGNHESRGPIYDQVFAWPGGGLGRNYFLTTLSPQVFFVTLNTETKADGEQKSFLDSALASASRMRWRVAQYHRPVYPAVKKPGAGLTHWVPLFEKHNLALACEADGHCIKRTVPIRGGKADPTGVVYIGEGGLGVGQRRPKTGLWYLASPGMVSAGHHVQLLSFSRTGLRINVIGINGNVLDTYTIANRRKEAPRTPKKPTVGTRKPGVSKPAAPKPSSDEQKAAQLYEMAKRAQRMGQRAAASSFYSRIVKSYPDTTYAERALKQLEQLKR